MNEREQYTLHIDAFTRDSIPMARLAEYLTQFAALLGHAESVHFLRVEDGSVPLVVEVEYEAIPKVRSRLRSVTDGEHSEDTRKAFDRINAMLRDDNGVATLKRNADNILRFPGKEIPLPQKIGPINQLGSLTGILIRIGGRDATVPAALADSEGNVHSCNVSRDMARDLAKHLFGATVRVTGAGRWERQETGEWKLLQFRGTDFEVLDDAPLTDVVERLREVSHEGGEIPDDPLGMLAVIRGGDLH
ncbi:MAG: hypothetical protein HY943_06680 [Gammaproteobacteria bacterium]|nr:hypothetical protein [Gammaproteobacteria bacterium]